MLLLGPCAWEEWRLREHRCQHREAIIAVVKRSPDYVAVATRGGARPPTPDPRNEEISKRSFEKLVKQWRTDLKEEALAAGGLAVVHPPGVFVVGVDLPVREGGGIQPRYVDPPAWGEGMRAVAPPPGQPLRVPFELPRGANEVCNEETWERRMGHRAAGVAAVKRSKQYVIVTENPNTARPRTPDPTDRKLSKRAWERRMQQWRMDLDDVVRELQAAP